MIESSNPFGRWSSMPAADASFGWLDAALALTIVVVVAFLVTWLFTDVLQVRRSGYVAILTMTVAALGGGYLAWSGKSLRELVLDGWAWGLALGVSAAAVVVPLVRRLPSRARARGGRFRFQLVWEGFVYGFDEAILLAALPVIAVWQGADALGWTDTTWTRISAGAAAIVASLLVILVHHLGYEEFRRREAQRMLAGALLACGLQAFAFVLCGNVLAPVIAHVVLHVQLLSRGDEMPPSIRRIETTRLEEPLLAA